eukprot:CAMPEP_0172593246 /NCGR_PEP_ID=MMETSP1068-20121228/12433_1 /TAXON_ID=35684 /ORGANISM="Pseudopedinella elastica, Strain CCMP716" /LENGTH=94 /DNA_ID=CAMNT_0013390681 /DNA_START=47 /DNA_END=331 /DNA_ORIENTATION=-
MSFLARASRPLVARAMPKSMPVRNKSLLATIEAVGPVQYSVGGVGAASVVAFILSTIQHVCAEETLDQKDPEWPLAEKAYKKFQNMDTVWKGIH